MHLERHDAVRNGEAEREHVMEEGSPEVYVKVYVRYMIGTCFQTYTSSESPINKGLSDNQGICFKKTNRTNIIMENNGR